MGKQQTTVITLIRHGVTDWNEAGRMQGHTDIPLNERGHLQARMTADYLATLQPQPGWRSLYCSDLARARETATPIGLALGLQLQENAALRERSLGPLEGIVWSDVGERFPKLAEHWPHLPDHLVPAGLETPAVVGDRAHAWCEAIWRRHPGEGVLAVSHGGWIGSLCEALGFERRLGLRLGNCSVTTVAWGPNGGHVLGFADDGHLVPLRKASGDQA